MLVNNANKTSKVYNGALVIIGYQMNVTSCNDIIKNTGIGQCKTQKK